ncbi:MAG: suppressor of fused domain protein [Woeseiaceae bacterium]|nr:suppressor of fused domain protein [Woeseiaceae bacterium]
MPRAYYLAALVALTYWLDPEFSQLEVSSGDTINFCDVVPLYSEEMKLKLNQGVEEFEARFDTLRLGYVLDVDLPNAALGRDQTA